MASTLSPTVTIKEPRPKLGGGGRDFTPHDPGRGGGDGRGDEGGLPDYSERLRRYRLGLTIGLASVVMLFVSFTSAYIVRQGLGTWDAESNTYKRDWSPVNLPISLMLLNTSILLASSVTIELARRGAAREAAIASITAMPGISAGGERPVPWLGITLVLGLGFLTGQWMVWRELAHRGFYLASTPSSSFFYVLTGMHGLHLAGGIIALLYAASTSLLSKPLETRRIVVDVTAWYWHFMGLLWLYVFALLVFAR
jgi:cytochrome c oxidase subunit 3